MSLKMSNVVDKICYDLRLTGDGNGNKVLQVKWLPITLDNNMSITPNGKPGEWENVEND